MTSTHWASRATLAGGIVRFLVLFGASLAVVIVLALAEVVVLRFRYGRPLSPISLEKINIGDFAVAPNGKWGVSHITFHVEPRVGASTGTLAPYQPVSDVLVYDLCEPAVKRLHIQGCHPRFVAVSPDGDELAVVCEDKWIRIVSGFSERGMHLSTDESGLKRLALASENLDCLAFSPDGRLLLGMGNRSIHVWRWPTGEFVQRHLLPNPTVDSYRSFSADCRCILSFPSIGEAYLWDARTGCKVKTIAPADGTVWSGVLSPDGTIYAVKLVCGDVRVYRTATGDELWRARPLKIDSPLIAFSRCGRFLAQTGRKLRVGTIIVFDAINGQVVCELYGSETPITGLAAGPGSLLYSIDSAGIVRCWDLERGREKWHFPTVQWGIEHHLFQHGP